MQQIILQGQPVIPSKIVCVGRNYVKHIIELNNEVSDEMVLFSKPNSAISNKLIAFQDEPLHYEAELCFLYQNGAFNAVAIGIDLTKRHLQSKLKKKGLPWERAKAFNGSAVFSEFVALEEQDKVHNFSDLTLKLYIDDTLVQAAGTELMLFKPDEILAEINSFMQLNDGDIVMTGTPEGVGEVIKGKQFIGQVCVNNKVLVTASWIAI